MNLTIANQFDRLFRRRYSLVVLVAFVSFNLSAQQKKVISLSPMHLVRYDKNYDKLTFSKDAPIIQRVKHIDLNLKSTYLFLVGEVNGVSQVISLSPIVVKGLK